MDQSTPSLSDDMFVGPQGLMCIDSADRYACQIFGVCLSRVGGVDYMVWEGDCPSEEDSDQLMRHE